jgi:hypothetical protein
LIELAVRTMFLSCSLEGKFYFMKTSSGLWSFYLLGPNSKYRLDTGKESAKNFSNPWKI